MRYRDWVNFLAVSVDPADTREVLHDYQQANSYPWVVAPGNREIVERYNVMTTMSKYAVDAEGMIALHGGHTVSDSEDWERVLEGLVRR